MTGKAECKVFKTMCKSIADVNGIECLTAECNPQEECYGYCKICQAEARYLDSELMRLVREGKEIKVAGVVYEAILKFLDSVNIQENSDNVEEYTDDQKELLSTPIVELDLSVRTLTCLKRAGIYTVEDLTDRTTSDILHIRQLGKKSLEEILQKLHSLELYCLDEQLEFAVRTQSDKELQKTLDATTICAVGFSEWTLEYLLRGDVQTVGDLIRKTPLEVYCIKDIRSKHYREIIDKLQSLGLSLKE